MATYPCLCLRPGLDTLQSEIWGSASVYHRVSVTGLGYQRTCVPTSGSGLDGPMKSTLGKLRGAEIHRRLDSLLAQLFAYLCLYPDSTFLREPAPSPPPPQGGDVRQHLPSV